MELSSILLAFAAGIVGASMGGIQSFVFCGLVGMAGMGIDAALGGGLAWIGAIPFGFWFHPAMAFLGGVGASAYARKMGYIESAKAGVGAPLVDVKKPDVLLIGGLVGAIGYITMILLTGADFLGIKADGGAIAIWPLSLILKAIFDGGDIFGKVPDEIKAKGGRFANDYGICWAPQHRGGFQKVVLGLGWGAVSAYATWFTFSLPGCETFAPYIGFFISASTLFFLLGGQNIPVTHHITLPAGYGVLLLVTANGGSIEGIALYDALLWGVAMGMFGAFSGEFWADVFYVFGDVHVDPPAMAICTVSLFTMTFFPALGLDSGVIVPIVVIALSLVAGFLGKPRDAIA